MNTMSSGSGSSVPQPAVFLSYAREDATAVRRIAEALRGAGVEVWFDENELRGGDAWDKAIRKQVRDCTLFLPIISASTQARHEGYFRLEWHLAEQRSLLIVKGRAFIVPVCIDATPERDALVPEAFMAVQWIRVTGEETLSPFVERVKALFAGGVAQASSPASRSRAGGTPALPSIPDYEMLRVIGRGSYGDVWLARGVTGIYRAIKVVWRERFDDAAPFEREFKGLKEFAAISLGESIQMALLHIGRNDDAGYFYYVMELADDATRGREIEPSNYVPLTLTEARKRRGRLPAAECVGIGVELARVLAGLHRRGLIHRDIKPSNIIFVGGVAKLADIGLVTVATDASTFVGTEGFVPPEGPGSASADVYALGKLLYELATGLDRQEFPQLPAELNQLSDRKILFELNEILLRACDPDRGKRYRTADAMLADLLAMQAGISLRQRRVGKKVFRFVAAAAAVAAVVAGGLFLTKNRPTVSPLIVATVPAQPAVAEKSVAVLAFANLIGDKAQEYFSDGISEELLSVLAKIPGLKVSGRTSAFSFKGRAVPAIEIARQLGVTYILDGSVRREGEHVRITAQLIKAADEAQVWTETFERNAKEVFAVQDEVAARIATKLQLKFVAGPPVAVNPEAFELYLQGRQQWNIRTPPALAKAEELFNRALVLDPKLIRAHAGLADVALLRSQVGKRIDFYPDRQAPALAALVARIEQALALDSNVAEIHTSLGGARLFGWDFAGAERALRQAIALNPNYGTAHQWLGRVLIVTGRMDEGLAELKLAASVDPLSARIVDNYAYALMLAGRLTESLTVIDRSLAISPGGWQATNTKIEILLRLHRDAEALAMVREIGVQDPTYRIGPPPPLLALVGLRREAEAVFKRSPDGPNDAGLLLALDRREEALATLTAERVGVLDLDSLLYKPTFDGSRAEPRFVQMIAGIGLTEAHARAQAWRAAHPPEAPAPSAKLSLAAPPPDENSIAVLPFANLSGDPAQAFFADGLTEAILDALARESGLRVIGRSSSFALRDKQLAAQEIGRALNVGRIVEGSVQREGGNVRIRVSVTRAIDGVSESLGPFDRAGTEIFALQDEVARAVVRKLAPRATTDSVAPAPTSPGLPKVAAYETYLRGRALQTGGLTGAAGMDMVGAYEEAVRLDPNYAVAWARLAQGYLRLLAGNRIGTEGYAIKSREAAATALRLAPGLPEAHLATARAHLNLDNDLDATQRELEEAIRLRPNDAEALAMQAEVERMRGHWGEELVRLIERAVERDPRNADTLSSMAGILQQTGRFADAHRLYERSRAVADIGILRRPMAGNWVKWTGDAAGAGGFLDGTPAGTFDPVLLPKDRARMRALEGDTAAAIAEYEKVRTLAAGTWELLRTQLEFAPILARLEARRGNVTRARELYSESLEAAEVLAKDSPNNPGLKWAIAEARAGRGEKTEARAAMAEALKAPVRNEFVASVAASRRTKAQLLAQLGENDGAIAELRAMHEMGWGFGHLLRIEPEWDPLRGDPKFQQLMKEAEARANAQPRPSAGLAPTASKPTTAITPAPAAAKK